MITPSTPTKVETVNEINGSTNEGFDYNHKSVDEDESKTDAENTNETNDPSQYAIKSKDATKSVDEKTGSLKSESGSNTCTTGFSNSTSSSDSKALDIDKTLRNHFTLLSNMGSSSELSLESVSSLGDHEGPAGLSSIEDTVTPDIDRSATGS